MNKRKKLVRFVTIFIPIFFIWRHESSWWPIWIDQIIATICILELAFFDKE